MIYWFFGLPGTGKDYCVNILANLINAKYVNVDELLTNSDKEKIIDGSFTIEERLRVLKKSAYRVKYLLKDNKNIIAAFTLPDHKSRAFLKNYFKNSIIFILVKVDLEILKTRISKRKNHFFTENILANYIKEIWQEPIKIPFYVLNNNLEGEDVVISELKKILYYNSSD